MIYGKRHLLADVVCLRVVIAKRITVRYKAEFVLTDVQSTASSPRFHVRETSAIQRSDYETVCLPENLTVNVCRSLSSRMQLQSQNRCDFVEGRASMDEMSNCSAVMLFTSSQSVYLCCGLFVCLSAIEYCLEQQLDTKCGSDEIIVVDNAQYGRMRINRCVHTDYGYIGCGTDVTDVLVGTCSGRHRCRVVNIEALFAAWRVCPIDLKSYLQVNFSCIKGMNIHIISRLLTSLTPTVAIGVQP